MSMHEIEDMVMGAILALDRHEKGFDLRSCFARLYRFQGDYDCSFTHFRVMNILLERRFAYRFALADHPDYETRRDFFDAIDDFAYLHENARYDVEDWDGDEEPPVVAGYVDPPDLYCDAGSALWRRMVECGRLTGSDSEPPQSLPLIQIVRDVAIAAELDGDRDLIAMWFNMGPSTLLADTFVRTVRPGDVLGRNPFTGEEIVADCERQWSGPFTVEQMAAVPEVQVLRDVVRRTRALEVKLHYDYRPPAEVLALDPVDGWWWALASSATQ